MVQLNALSAFLLASCLSSFAFAQTHSDCNPLKDTCPNNPALQQKFLTLDFTQTKSLPDGWTTENQGQVNFDADGAKLIVAKSNDSRNIISKFYVLFGSFEFKVKAAPGKGIVSTVVLISDDLDEVDWEILSIEPNDVQSNYFGKGDDSDFKRGRTLPAPNNQNTWHTYRFDWTPEYVAWSIDGKVVRTLLYNEAKEGSRFPQTPMRIKIGAWAAGDPSTNREGTVVWSGGPTDWSAGPFVMSLESIKIVNYTPAKEYVYSDKSGSYQSIKVIGGTLMSDGGDAPPPPQLPSPPASSVAPPPPPPISLLKPTASPSTSQPPVPVPTTSITTVAKPAPTAPTSAPNNATKTSAKPAVATTNSATAVFLGSGAALGALAVSIVWLL